MATMKQSNPTSTYSINEAPVSSARKYVIASGTLSINRILFSGRISHRFSRSVSDVAVSLALVDQ
jgi:hypothetical protein